MGMGMKFSLIIPCYLLPDKNHELLGFTMKCINSIRKHLSDYELILVDNGSTVDSNYLIEQADVYIRNKANLGFAPAVNQGLKIARGEYIAVCNNDIEFIHDWLSLAWDSFKPKTGVISSHLHDHDPQHNVGRIDCKWGGMFGALWITTKSAIDKVGYLDEGYRVGMWEDRDYWKRMEEAGYELAKVGWCNHTGNATWGKMPNQNEIFIANEKRFKDRWL
jgi:GT2 family glycosyltransferase